MAKKAQPTAGGSLVTLAPKSEDEQIISESGTHIRQFLAGLSAFFSTAGQIETSAKHQLALALARKLPASADEDVALQRDIKAATAEKKAAEEHWNGGAWKLTKTVHAFHRRITAARDRAIEPLEETNTILNRLHNDYVAQERRKAAQEQERIRIEAEARARAKREAEQAAMEAAAVAREELSPDLSERERAFVDLFTSAHGGGDGQGAARVAGYKEPLKAAARLLSNAKIQQAIAARREALAIRAQAQARAAEPVYVDVPTVAPNVAKASGAVERRGPASCEIVDAAAFVAAALSGQYGIPAECLMPYQAELNRLARSIGVQMNRIPGLRYVAGESKVI